MLYVKNKKNGDKMRRRTRRKLKKRQKTQFIDQFKRSNP